MEPLESPYNPDLLVQQDMFHLEEPPEHIKQDVCHALEPLVVLLLEPEEFYKMEEF